MMAMATVILRSDTNDRSRERRVTVRAFTHSLTVEVGYGSICDPPTHTSISMDSTPPHTAAAEAHTPPPQSNDAIASVASPAPTISPSVSPAAVSPPLASPPPAAPKQASIHHRRIALKGEDAWKRMNFLYQSEQRHTHTTHTTTADTNKAQRECRRRRRLTQKSIRSFLLVCCLGRVTS